MGERPHRHRLLILALMVAVSSLAACRGKKPVATATSTKVERITTPPMQIAETTNLAPGAISSPAPILSQAQRAGEGEAHPPLAEEVVTQIPVIDAYGQATQAYIPTAVKARTNILLLVDGSGSMNALLAGGVKVDLLKKTLKDLAIQPFPADTQRFLGLRVFGATAAIEEKDCQDTQILSPIKPIEASPWASSVDKLGAKGSSPLAYAMDQTAEDFPNASEDSDNLLIVVTDGGDTCQQDPCDVALKLHQSAKKIIIHLIGFDLDSRAQTQLTCIPKSADGQFYLARNEYELRNDLEQAIYANYPYNLRLKVVAGATPIPATLTAFSVLETR